MDLPQSSHHLSRTRLLSALACSTRSPNRRSRSSFFQTTNSIPSSLFLISKSNSCSIRIHTNLCSSLVNPVIINSRLSATECPGIRRTDPGPGSVTTVESSPLAVEPLHFFRLSIWTLISCAPCAVLYHNRINQRRNLSNFKTRRSSFSYIVLLNRRSMASGHFWTEPLTSSRIGACLGLRAAGSWYALSSSSRLSAGSLAAASAA